MASVMVLAIKQFGWRSIYYISGSVGLFLFTLTRLFIKNPDIPSDPAPKMTEEDEDKLMKTIRINKDVPEPPQIGSSEMAQEMKS